MNTVMTAYLTISMLTFMMLMLVWSSKNLLNVLIKALLFVLMGVSGILLASHLGLVITIS